MNTLYVVDISAFYGDETCLSSPLGVETGLIKDYQMTARSKYNQTTSARHARLAGPGAWCSKQIPSLLRIDLIVLHFICAVTSQGFYEQGYYATKYMILLKTGVVKDYYKERDGTLVSLIKY